MSLRGVIPPLVTPFHADGGLDLEAFSGSLEALAAHERAMEAARDAERAAEQAKQTADVLDGTRQQMEG